MTAQSLTEIRERLNKEYAELQGLAQYIRQAKLDIVAIRPKDITADHIPRATDELDAVVGATEEATNRIMDMCDQITVIASACSQEVNDRLTQCVTHIFEACNFQDITGQRITKVVTTLKHIDHKIDTLVKTLGEDVYILDGISALPSVDSEKSLLNGPKAANDTTNQDDIDKLLNS